MDFKLIMRWIINDKFYSLWIKSSIQLWTLDIITNPSIFDVSCTYERIK